jgi:hypothetical protein
LLQHRTQQYVLDEIEDHFFGGRNADDYRRRVSSRVALAELFFELLDALFAKDARCRPNLDDL